MTTISVIIPNYNRAKLIGATIENMLSQTLKPSEIIVIDDGSTDESVQVISSFGRDVTLICQENQGPGAARNAGLKVASGEFIQFFDSDDLCSLNKLECQAEALSSSGADMAYSPWVQVKINGNSVKYEDHVIQQRALPGRLSPLEWFLRGWTIVFQSCMFRHSFLKQVGGYRTDIMPTEDSEFLFRMLLNKAKLCFTPDCLTIYRVHSMGQITSSGTEKSHRIKDCNKYLQIVCKQLEKSNIDIDSVTRLMFKARMLKSLKYMKNISVSIEDEEFLNGKKSEETLIVSGLCGSINFYRRIESGLRARILGSRYLKPYKASSPKTFQDSLIAELGLNIE